MKRKPKNRRSQREHILDVKVRSNAVRAARLRLFGFFLTACFALCFALFGLRQGIEWTADRLVFQNDAFAVREIDIQTDGLIAPEHLRRWAMVKQGDNLLALDLARIKRDLEMTPAIRAAVVERTLPGALRIRVSEREPIAQVLTVRLRPDGQHEHGVFHLDRDGFVMLPLDPRLMSGPPAFPYEYLPVISGVDPAEIVPGRRVESSQVHAALRLVSRFELSPMFGVADVHRIEVGAADVLVAHTGTGAQTVLGLDGFDLQLQRWRIIHDHFAALGKSIVTLDLSVSNNVPARVSDAGPSVPRSKPIRDRRRNV